MDHGRQAQQDLGESVAAHSAVGSLAGREQLRTAAAICAAEGRATKCNIADIVEILFAFPKVVKSEGHAVTTANPVHIVGELKGFIGSEKVFVEAYSWLVKKRPVVEDIQAE